MSLHCWVVFSVGWRSKEWMSGHAVVCLLEQGMVKSFVLCCFVLCCCVWVRMSFLSFFPFIFSMCMSHSCLTLDNEWGWGPHIMYPGLRSHSGPHHSRQFCLMCMQGKYQERERFCCTPSSGTPLLHLFYKAFLLSTTLCPHKLLLCELSHLNAYANFQTLFLGNNYPQ